MSTEKSELHVTNIERSDKTAWVAAAQKEKKNLVQWVIDALNDKAKKVLEKQDP